MTIQEMHYDFEVKFNQLSEGVNQYFTPAQKDWLLNRAQDIVIQKRIGLNNNRKQGLEMTQQRIEDLKKLHVRYPEQPLLTPIEHDDNVFEVDLGTLAYEYLHYIRATVNVEIDNCSYSGVVKIIQSDDIGFALADPFNKSSKEEVLANFGRNSGGGNSSLYLYPDVDTVVKSLKLEYLKKPKFMSIGGYQDLQGTLLSETQCELSDHMHPQIVDQAVELASRSVQDPNIYGFAQQGLLQQE